MFGLKPPLYYLPGKRAVRLLGSYAAPARLGWPTHSTPQTSPAWVGTMGPRSPSPAGRRAGARGPGCSRCGPAGGVCATCGGEHPPARTPPPPRRHRGLRVSFLLSARSWLRGGGGAARGRSTQGFGGELSTGCEVTFLQADAIGWHAPSPRPQSRGLFSSPSSQPRARSLPTVVRPPPSHLAPPLPARDSLEGSLPAQVGGESWGKLGRVVGVASCFPNLRAL